MSLMEEYKQGLEKKKNLYPLNNDYLKFIRFGEWKIVNNGYGVMGIITNNSFIDGNLHISMRKHLLKSFDKIYIYNLHGYTDGGEKDENVFDITVGFCISFFIRLESRLAKKMIKFNKSDYIIYNFKNTFIKA